MDALYRIDGVALDLVFAIRGSSLGPVADRASVVLDNLGLFKVGPLIVALFATWLAPAGMAGRPVLAAPEQTCRGGLGLLVALAAGRVLQQALPVRDRPRFVLPDRFAAFEQLQLMRDWSSMPSDHAVMVGALAAATWVGSRRLGLAAAAWGAVVVCLPRLVLGLHFLSDLLVGAALGAAIVAVGRRMTLPEASWAWLGRLDARAPAFVVLGLFLFGWEVMELFDAARWLLRNAGRAVSLLMS